MEMETRSKKVTKLAINRVVLAGTAVVKKTKVIMSLTLASLCLLEILDTVK